MKVGTRLAMTVTAFAFAARPAVSLADGGSTHATAEKQCTSMRTSMGKQTFSEAFGKNRNDRNAFGKCVSKQQSQDTTDQANAHNSAEKTCRAQQSDPNFSTTTGGGKTFDQFYGTNKNDRNAFGNCVSQNAKAQSTSTENSQVQAQDKAAKTCLSQQSDPNFSTTTGGGKTFNQFYGTNKNDRNAFGKCVSKNAKAQEHSSSSTSS